MKTRTVGGARAEQVDRWQGSCGPCFDGDHGACLDAAMRDVGQRCLCGCSLTPWPWPCAEAPAPC